MSFRVEARQDRSLAERLGIEARLNPPKNEKDIHAVNIDGIDTLQVIDVLSERPELEERDIADRTGLPLDVVKEKIYDLQHSEILEKLI